MNCNCCERETYKSAWCDECGVAYQGGTETGLLFYCPDHNKEVEIIIAFGSGFVEPERDAMPDGDT